MADLEHKKSELTEIVAETEKEEAHILIERVEVEKHVEEKLIKAYDRIRLNVKNGIAVAQFYVHHVEVVLLKCHHS